MAQRKQDRDRFKYGICLNDECPKCKAKEVQQISLRKEFVCAECGSELRECPPPKKKNFKPLIILLVLLVLVGAIVAVVLLMPKKEKAPKQEPTKVEVVENPAVEEPAAEEPVVEEPVAKSAGNVDYGQWTGEFKNGKPNGMGTMKYTKEHLIDSRDPKARVAQKGDYIVGEFDNGKLVQGRWFDSQNNLKGSILIGR